MLWLPFSIALPEDSWGLSATKLQPKPPAGPCVGSPHSVISLGSSTRGCIGLYSFVGGGVGCSLVTWLRTLLSDLFANGTLTSTLSKPKEFYICFALDLLWAGFGVPYVPFKVPHPRGKTRFSGSKEERSWVTKELAGPLSSLESPPKTQPICYVGVVAQLPDHGVQTFYNNVWMWVLMRFQEVKTV